MNCPYCANAVPDGAGFCGNCGAKLDAASTPASLPPQVAAETPQEPVSPPPFVMEPAAPPPGFTPAYTPPPPAAKKSNTTLIIIVVVVLLLLCCCCALFVAFGPIAAMLTDITTQVVGPTPRIVR
jgi:hypothetical protein